jgi:hypothetical protein
MDMELGSLGRLRPPVIAGALLAANAILAFGLAALALAPRPVRVVPAARAEAELWPGAVPAAAAREFALRYVSTFDNWTPPTVEAATEALKRMVAARSYASAAAALDKRVRVAVEARMSVQALPGDVEVDGLRVRIKALRRTFVSDKLSRESKAVYEIALEKQPATDANPFGLAVVSQDIREE